MAQAASSGLYAYDFGDAPSSKDAATAGKAAIKAAISSAAKSSAKSKTEGSGFGVHNVAARQATKPIAGKPPVKNNQFDPNTAFAKGGSMVTHGGSMITHGGSMRSHGDVSGGSFKSHGGAIGGGKPHMVKGSQAANDHMKRLREMRN